MPKPASIVPQAVVFELALGLVGAVIALWLETPLRDRLVVDPESIARGAAACAPMLLGLAVVVEVQWPPLVRLRRQVQQVVSSLFDGVHWVGLAAVSVAAGVGEEILFRGALQPLLASWTTPLAGLAIASLLFGLVHAASTTYFLLATLVGVYLGWIAQHFDDLVAPIIAHAGYDFAALWYLQRSAPRGE